MDAMMSHFGPFDFQPGLVVTEPLPGSHCILVVDDEAAVRRFVTRALHEQGFLVLEALDGLEALDRVRAAQVDVLVSDIVMPRLNGVQLMQALAASHPQLPVVLMSGYATHELAGMGIAAPCALLTKPFSAERLVEEVRRCLGDADPMAVAPPGRAGE
jgi:DNA-binding NtrC family response regulator